MGRIDSGIYRDKKDWYLNFNITINGITHRISKRGFKTAGEAAIEKQLIIKNLYDQEEIKSLGDFGSLLVDFFDYKKGLLKESTWYRSTLIADKHFASLKTKSIKDIVDYNHLLSMKRYFDDLKLTPNYVNKVIKLFNDFMDYIYRRGLMSSDDFNNVNLVMTYMKDDNNSKKDKKDIWTKDEFLKFLSIIPKDSRDYVLFSLWGQIGARIGEIRALQVKHLNIKKSLVVIEQQANSKLGRAKVMITSPKTKASYRSIPITSSLVSLMVDFISSLELENEDFIFHGASRTLPLGENSIRAALSKYIKLAGIKYIPPHGIRHSNTTWLLSGEHSLEEIGLISERLGHTNKTTTLNIYFHINKKDSKNILDSLSFLD